MKPLPLTLIAIVSAFLPPIVSASPAAAAETTTDCSPRPGDPGLSAEVVTPPSPMPATDQKVHLVYEVFMRNTSATPVSLDRFVVCDPARGRPVDTLEGDAIERRMIANGAFTRTLGPGESGFLMVDVRLRPEARVPAGLTHRLNDVSAQAPTRIDRRPPIRLSLPLDGPNIGVIGCCDLPLGHRRALLNLDGRSVIAQRYAIDFLRLDDGLNSLSGDPARNESYFIFGDDITAAAPGRVVAVRDGVPENTPPNPPANLGLNDLAGNYVVQDFGGGRFALYAHLQTGSVRVRAGDRIERGQLLGQVGNTGNSTQPHLHFHVTDGSGLPSGLAADGAPYLFDRFAFEERITGLDLVPPVLARVPAEPPHRRTAQYPLTGDIIG